MNRLRGIFFWLILPVVAAFALFPLTDTDIWWHLACAREWVTTWTPVREPVVNVHYYFQQVVAFVYGIGGAQALVFFKAFLWGIVFALFMKPFLNREGKASFLGACVGIVLLFLFRYQMEMRPVVFSLLFLGIYWNILPFIFQTKTALKKWAACLVLLVIQWFWCKTQGLFILGPILTAGVFLVELLKAGDTRRKMFPWGLFPLAMFCMPFLHREGLSLFLYPFGLLDRLLGLSQSATIFASEIAENRSPVTLLQSGENTLVSFGMVFLAVISIGHEILRVLFLRKQVLQDNSRSIVLHVTLLVTAVLSLMAERNLVLFLPVLLVVLLTTPKVASFANVIPASEPESASRILRSAFIILIAFIFGLWIRSLQVYDHTMVSYQRVPVAAAVWMKANPHDGRLFNDDRAGGYLAFVNPSDSTYIDGRFILKTADFFEQYLGFAENPETFVEYAVQNQIGRVILPTRYYARWKKLIADLDSRKQAWNRVYQDEYFVVFDRPFIHCHRSVPAKKWELKWQNP